MTEEATNFYELQGIEGGITVLKTEILQIWQNLNNSESEIHKAAINHGIDLSELPKEYKSFIKLTKPAAGFDASISDLIVTLASGKVAKDLWTYIILPQLRHRFGDQSLKEKKAKKKKDQQ